MLADVQGEVVSIVNTVMAELLPSPPRALWTAKTVKEKFRYIKDQYDKCVKLIKATGNGDNESSTLAATINDLTPYYHELVAILEHSSPGTFPLFVILQLQAEQPLFLTSQTSRNEPLVSYLFFVFFGIVITLS